MADPKRYANSSEVFAAGLCLALYNISEDRLDLRHGDEAFKLTPEQAKGLERIDIDAGYGPMSAYRLDDVRKAANG